MDRDPVSRFLDSRGLTIVDLELKLASKFRNSSSLQGLDRHAFLCTDRKELARRGKDEDAVRYRHLISLVLACSGLVQVQSFQSMTSVPKETPESGIRRRKVTEREEFGGV